MATDDRRPRAITAVRTTELLLTRTSPSPESVVVKVDGEEKLRLSPDEARSLQEQLGFCGLDDDGKPLGQEQAPIERHAIDPRALPQAVLDAVVLCFARCQGMARYSTEESDEYWELADNLMEMFASSTGRTMDRKPMKE